MVSRAVALQEKTAWLNYKGYVLFAQSGNRGTASIGVFKGDERSCELWRDWMAWRQQLLVMRRR